MTEIYSVSDEQFDALDRQLAREKAIAAPAVGPDEMARALTHAQKRGAPPLLVASSLSEYDELDTLDRFSEAAKDSRIGRWLTPARAALAKDDLPALTKMTQALRAALPIASVNPAAGLATFFGQAVDRPAERLGRIGQRVQASAAGTVGQVQRVLGDEVGAVVRQPQEILATLYEAGGAKEAAQFWRKQDLGGLRAFAAQGAGVAREAAADRQALAAQAQRPGADALGAGNAFEYYGGMVGDSLPPMLAAMATRNPNIGAAVMGSVTYSAKYDEALNEGDTPERARQRAFAQAVPEVLFEQMALARAFGSGSFASRFAGTLGIETAGEGATTLAQATGDAAITGKALDRRELALQTIDSMVVGAVMSGPQAALGARPVLEVGAKIGASQTAARGLQAFTESAAESKTAQRAPQEVEALVGDAGYVYVPMDAVRTLYQSDDVARFVAEVTGDEQAFEFAGDTGDVKIPLAKWASTVARLPNAAEWAKAGRTDADGYSRTEMDAADFLEREFGIDNATAAEAAKPANPEATKRIEQDVYGQLLGTGRYQESEAAAQAKFMARVFGTLGQRAGVDAGELYDRYNLRIQGPRSVLNTKPNTLDDRTNALVTAVRTRKIPDAREVHGHSLLTWIIKRGGVQDYSGELVGRDAMKLRPGLVNRAGESLDYIREAAVQEKYLPEGADINDLLDAIDTELRGTPVYSERIASQKAADFRADALALSRDMDEAFRDVPADEFAQLSNQEIVDRLMQGAERPNLFQRAAAAVKALFQGPVYPLAEPGTRYEETDRPVTWMTPDEYLARVRPLEIDEGSRDNIDDLKEHIKAGRTLDPLHIRADGKEDGRHRAHAARELGIERVPVIDEQIKSATANAGTFAPSNPSILNQPADGGLDRMRGGIDLLDTRNVTIGLFANADLSTFLHEGAHFYFQVLSDLAADPNAPAQVRADMDTLLTWGQVPGETPEARLAHWRGLSIPEQRDVHEGVAEAFERYLQDGKAPAAEVASLFGRFRAWLVGVYKALRPLSIPLNDEVRAVFDRLVATDEEIEAANAKLGGLTDEQLAAAGFEADEIAAHRAKVEAAIEAGKAKLAAQTLRAYERERKAWWRKQRAAVLAEVEAEFESEPIVRAWRVLAAKDGPKLDMAQVKAALPGGIVPEGFPKGVTGKNGKSPDAIAMLFGFDSGDALLQGLSRVKDTAARVEAEADARMRERYGDPLTDGTLPEKAMSAAHNAKRIAALEDELRMLEMMAADPTAVPQEKAKDGTPAAPRAPLSPERRAQLRAQAAQRAQVRRAFKLLAERRVAGQKIRDLKPAEHLAAERRAMKAATEATLKGEFVKAARAKREQILQASLYRAARDAQVRASKQAKALRKQGETKARAKLGKAGADYLEQVDGLLERFDFRKVSDAASDRRQSLRTWFEAQQAAGIPVDIPESLLDDAYAVPFRELTVAELDELSTTVKHLVHLAGLKNRLLLKGELRDRAEIDAAMAESVREAHTARGGLGLPSTGDRLFDGRMEFRAIQGTATDLARELDGFKDGGPVWEHTVGVIRDAVLNRLNPALNAEQEAVAAMYLAHYSKAELRELARRRNFDGLGTWTKERILALALNWGNEGNRTAILSQARNALTAEQVGFLLQQLDARDVAFVQSAWARIDSHWPALAEAHKRRTGLPLKKVEASPFTVTTADGQTLTLPGGYYPLKFEADSIKAMKDEAEDLWDALRLGRTAKAATKDGHRKERVGSGGRSVRLDLSVMDTHLRDVLRDVHLGDAVNYVHHVLNGDEFGGALADTGTLALRKGLEVWLKDVAAGEIGARVWYEHAARFVRTNFTAAVLTFKVSSAALQITGFSSSASILGPKLLKAVQQVKRHRIASYDYVDARSPMMKARAQGHQDAVVAVANARSGALAAGRAGMMRWGFWMMGRVQRQVDVVTWLAAEADAIDRGLDADAARLYADDVVTRAQGSQEFIDKTPLQRGTLGDTVRQSEWIRALGALSGYMLAKGNLLYEKTARTDFRRPGQALKWSAHMVNLLVFEAMVAAAIRGKLPDEDEDEDGDGMLDEYLAFAAKEAGFGLWGSIPGLNATSGSLRGYGSGGVISGMVDAFSSLHDQLKPKDGEWQEFDKAAQKATVKVIGYGTGAPSTAINTTIDAIHAEADGRDVAPYHYLVGPPKDD